jgi:hypothetical protein
MGRFFSQNNRTGIGDPRSTHDLQHPSSLSGSAIAAGQSLIDNERLTKSLSDGATHQLRAGLQSVQSGLREILPGESGPHVAYLQSCMNVVRESWGDAPLPVTGTMDEITVDAFVRFQEKIALAADGSPVPLRRDS